MGHTEGGGGDQAAAVDSQAAAAVPQAAAPSANEIFSRDGRGVILVRKKNVGKKGISVRGKENQASA